MEASLDGHFHVAGIPEQFALLTDAHLVVEGRLVPVHKSVLALTSPVFSDLFLAAAQASYSQDAHANHVPMPGHTTSDICMVLKYLYQRAIRQSADTPSKDLWKSVEDARPIIQFVHKFNMQTILEECDTCLSDKAQEKEGKDIFKDTDTVLAWTVMAEECGLKALLATAELFMIKNHDPAFWQSPAFLTYNISSRCLLRMLRGAQVHMNDAIKLLAPENFQDAEWARSECLNCRQKVFCATCSQHPLAGYDPTICHHVDLPTLTSWQQL